MIKSKNNRTDLFILAGLSLALFVYLTITSLNSAYGYFVDELYYIACSKRLAFGYVDHPPLSILLLAFSRWLFGQSVPAIRIFSSLGMAATVFMAGLLARRLGGSCAAMILAALAVIVMPIYLVLGSFYSMNAFEPLIWSLILYFLIRFIQENNPKLWLLIGLLLGLGLEMKHTMILAGLTLFLGMLLTNARRYLFNRWFLWGVLICAVCVLPNIVWQFLNGFPSLEFYRNAILMKNVPTPPLSVLGQQILFTNPAAFPLWLGGIAFLFFSPLMKNYRLFAWMALLLLILAMVSGSSRPDRITSMYVVLFAAGAVAFDKLSHPLLRRIFIIYLIVTLVIGGIVIAPFATPVLPPSATKSYLAALGLSVNLEKAKSNEPLPQWLADRFGWREKAADVARVYHSLPDSEQTNAAIVTTNYGVAGALELYGSEFGLPRVYATHNTYHSWGPPPDSIRTYILIFVNRESIENMFDSIAETSIHTCEHCSREQSHLPIYIARSPRFSVKASWPGFKIYC